MMKQRAGQHGRRYDAVLAGSAYLQV